MSTANPLPSGQTISATTIAIGGGFHTDANYPLTISGKLQNGNTFDYTVQVSIVPPAGVYQRFSLGIKFMTLAGR